MKIVLQKNFRRARSSSPMLINLRVRENSHLSNLQNLVFSEPTKRFMALRHHFFAKFSIQFASSSIREANVPIRGNKLLASFWKPSR